MLIRTNSHSGITKCIKCLFPEEHNSDYPSKPKISQRNTIPLILLSAPYSIHSAIEGSMNELGYIFLTRPIVGSGMARSCEITPSHQCGPGSIPSVDVICGLSLLLVLVPAPRSGFSHFPVFLVPQIKTKILKFQLYGMPLKFLFYGVCSLM